MMRLLNLTGNLRFRTNSVAIDNGPLDTTDLEVPMHDLDENPRLNGRIDIGAYENPYVNCPEIISLTPLYGPVSGSFTAQVLIVTEDRVVHTPNASVSFDAPKVQINPEFNLDSNAQLKIYSDGCAK